MENVLAVRSSDPGTADCTKEYISLTWTEVVRGVLVQILAQLVLPGASEGFTERYYSSSFLGCDAQCCFANLEHGMVGL